MNKALDIKQLTKDLEIDAKAIGIPPGAAESFIKNTVKNVDKALGKRKIITSKDLDRIVSKELAKYNADLAYVYKNRDTII